MPPVTIFDRNGGRTSVSGLPYVRQISVEDIGGGEWATFVELSDACIVLGFGCVGVYASKQAYFDGEMPIAQTDEILDS